MSVCKPCAPVLETVEVETLTVLGVLPARFPTGQSVTRLGSDEVTRRLIPSAMDLTAAAPNLAAFIGSGGRTPRFALRGLWGNELTSGEPTVTLYLDDVPYDELFSRGVPLFDLDTIDILSGPQGTWFGASRPEGIINVPT